MAKTYAEMKSKTLKSYTVSEWLKKAILELHERNILDALNDAEILAEIMQKRWIEKK